MAKQLNTGYTDTPISGVTALELNRGLLNFQADFRVKEESAKELIAVNLTSPVDRIERVKWAATEIANVYTGTPIDPSVMAPSRRGVSIVCQINETWSVTDTVDAAYRVDLPVQAHIVLKVPANENITSAQVEQLVGRLVSGLYDTGSETTTRLTSLLRGSLKPSDL